jgi:hypothetical protein
MRSMARPSGGHQHRDLYGPSAEPVQGFLEGLSFRTNPSKLRSEGFGQLALSALFTAFVALLSGLAPTIGVLVLLTRGMLATLLSALTLIVLAALLAATLVLATLVLVLIHRCLLGISPSAYCQRANTTCVPLVPQMLNLSARSIFLLSATVISLTAVRRHSRLACSALAQGRGAGCELPPQRLGSLRSLADSSTPGKCFLDMLWVFAESETNLRRERQLEGIAKAKAARVYKGRRLQ